MNVFDKIKEKQDEISDLEKQLKISTCGFDIQLIKTEPEGYKVMLSDIIDEDYCSSLIRSISFPIKDWENIKECIEHFVNKEDK